MKNTTWKIEYEKHAVKFLKNSEKSLRVKILQSISKISQNPLSIGKALTGRLKGLRRYRVENYRIIYFVKAEEITILILKIDHRSKIYK